MNKISKKIVSLVTMAAFALTLVPAAAFAAPADDIHATVTPTTEDVLLTDGSASIDLNVTIGDDWTATYGASGQLALWYGTADTAQPGVTFASKQAGFTDASNYVSTVWENTNWLPAGLTDGGNSEPVTVTFTKAGTYDLYAGAWISGQGLSNMASVEKVATVTVHTTDAVAGNSRLLIDGDDAAVSVAQNKAQEFEFNVRTADDRESAMELANSGETVYVWAENSKGEIVTDVTFAAVDTKTNSVAKEGTQGLWKVTGPVKDKTALTATFATAGDGYTLNATTKVGVPQITDKKVPASDNDLTAVTVNVTKEAVKTAKITFEQPAKDATVSGPDSEGNYTYTITDDVTPNGVKVYTVTGKAVDKNDVGAQGEVLKVTAKRGVTLGGLSDEGTVTTNARGEFEFTFTVNDNGEFDIDVEEVNGDASTTLTVVTDKFYVGNIKTVEDGGYLLAGNDAKYADSYVGTSRYFAEAVQFTLTDVNGNEVTGDRDFTNMYSLSVTKPDGSKLKADDLSLVWNEAKGVYTLVYTDKDNTGRAADLIPGEYTVKIAFKSSDKAATATFNLAKFGAVEDIVLDMYAGPTGWVESSDDAITEIDSQVALGQSVEVVPFYVDANGIKVKADYNDLKAGVNGDAVVDNGYTWVGGNLYFDTFDNEPSNNSLVGTTITVKVFDEENGKYVEKELTVVKNYLGETLSFDPTSGVVDEDNKVTVSVVDEKGNVSKVNGQLYAYVEDQSNADAYVEANVKNNEVKNGKGTLTLYSDAEGTADVRVVVEAANGELYGTTFTYTFGDEDEYAGRYVVMTIGSSDYLINNEIVKGDAAPYVDDAWRTMVPFRVLGEAFGAEVDWNQEAQSVTYTVGDTEIVMTIGENTYTLNGEEQTMDTAPVLSGDRTYVPVRFVAEDLGFEVTPLYDVENGATASVVFQK